MRPSRVFGPSSVVLGLEETHGLGVYPSVATEIAAGRQKFGFRSRLRVGKVLAPHNARLKKVPSLIKCEK